jgi:hypothetical protein
MGLLFWEWDLLSYPGSALGTFLFLIITVVVTLFYLRKKGVRQNAKSLTALAVVILGALPFILYDRIEINLLLLFFEFGACLVWVMYSTGTSISQKLSGFILWDSINQLFVVPFKNFFGIFACVKWGSRNRKGSRTFLFVVVGIAISIPLLVIVVALLTSADAAFARFMERLADLLNLERIGIYILELAVGIPIACYIFGAIYGNTQKRYTREITLESASASLARSHRIPRPAIYGPLMVFIVIYLCFFIAMGSYLFSAFAGNLPDAFSYADYARRGFFELCAVAAINLGIMAFVYALTKRAEKEYPKLLRALTAILSLLTALLIVTAVSKMLLYIGAFGLTRLRVYTLWFMALLLVIFVVLFIWHIKPFNAGKPIVLIAVCFILALFLSNTDGVIARYNVTQYESGQLKEVDIDTLTFMSDAALPSLYDLRDDADDPAVRKAALRAIFDHNRMGEYPNFHDYGYDDDYYDDYNDYKDDYELYDSYYEKSFANWNLQSALVRERFTASQSA